MRERFNVQVVDGAQNCAYDIFSVPAENFRRIFPAEDQDIEFIEDFVARGEETAARICDEMWRSRVDKKAVDGIHGTLFYGLDVKKSFYPTKRESDLDSAPQPRKA
jgi:hypothetical protein